MKDLIKLIQQFMTQCANRPEATEDLHDRLVQITAEVGKMAHSAHWNESKDKIQERVTHLLILLMIYGVQSGLDIEKAIKERLAKLPGQPAPVKSKERVRGLRL